MFFTNNALRAGQEDEGFSIRHLAFRDVTGDGISDAIIFVSSENLSTLRLSSVVVLTRKSSQQCRFGRYYF